MPAPHVSTAFADLLDPRFSKIFYEEYEQLPDMIGKLFSNVSTNGRNNMTWSNVGTVGDFTEFTGTVGYQSQTLGYNTTMTPVEFSNGIQVERKLFDDDQFHIMDEKPRGLATSAFRTRQKHGARPLNNAFSVDNYFYVNSEGVALCSDNHTTTSGASVASGFDNKVTSAMTAVAVASARIQMVQMRGDQAERLSIKPNELWFPPDLFEQAFEIVKSSGKIDVANNNRNVHEGVYELYEWNYLTSTKNWFMCDGTMRKRYAVWSDRVALEFAMAEDLDTLLAKWRAYMRYANAILDWRWITGASVT